LVPPPLDPWAKQLHPTGHHNHDHKMQEDQIKVLDQATELARKSYDGDGGSTWPSRDGCRGLAFKMVVATTMIDGKRLAKKT